MALEDADQWVSTVAELLKKYPATFQINFEIEQNAAVFTDLVSELKKIVKRHADKNILPLECLYLNKNALTSQVGSIPVPMKHFNLKRKPKSAALRAELLAKSSEAAASLKKPALTPVTVRARGLIDGLCSSLCSCKQLIHILHQVQFEASHAPKSGTIVSKPRPALRSEHQLVEKTVVSKC